MVAASLYFSISYSDGERVVYSGIGDPTRPSAGDASIAASDATPAEDLELDRVRLRQETELLNRLPTLLGPGLGEGQRATATRHVREVKLRLMRTVWAGDWSDPVDFRLWAEGGAEAADGEAFRRARAFYDAGAEPAS